MDIAPMVTTTTTTTNTVTILDPDSPEPEPEPPIRIQSAKPISFSNGKRHHHHHPHPPAAPPLGTVTYRECLKNHAAGIGGHALDGCGEFMPAPSFDPTDPTSLACAACGCHRNFHRRDDPSSSSAAAIEFRPHNRHQPPPPLPLPLPPPLRSPDDDSASPPPISSSYMLLALSGGRNSSGGGGTAAPGSQKRFRTKFSQYQKERMLEFAERLGWRMPKAAEDAGVREFCRQIGVDKGVFKVWMHNNKNNGRGGGRRVFGSIGGDRREKMGESDNVGGVAAEGSFST